VITGEAPYIVGGYVPFPNAADAIIARLLAVRYASPEPRKRGTGVRPIARAAGLSHMTLYRAIYTGQLSVKSAEALEPVLRA
jgi:hypothetical protein